MLRKIKGIVALSVMLAVCLIGAACTGASSSNDGCDHEYSKWEVGAEATCDSIGYEVRMCDLCDDLDYKIHQATGHDWSGSSIFTDASGQIIELKICSTCGTFKSATDNDGDTDGDGLTDAEEMVYNTAIDNPDTDGDGLSDYVEVKTYSTNPTAFDTDGDGASDGGEVKLGFDPLTAQTGSFSVTSYEIEEEPNVTPDIAAPIIEAEMSAEAVSSFKIERENMFSENSEGFLGDAYNYSVADNAVFSSAKVGFKYDKNKVNNDSKPTIYKYDEAENKLIPLATDLDKLKGEATTIINEFSTFVLIDRNVYESDSNKAWIDEWQVGTGETTKIQIVFVIDDSVSMKTNDPNSERLPVARDLIDKLPDGSEIGVVRFEEGASQQLTSELTTDKDVAKGYITSQYFDSSGSWTHMHRAIRETIPLYTATDASTMKMMVVLCDGKANDPEMDSDGGAGIQNTTIQEVNNAGINVYTIGLGSSVTDFDLWLKPVSEQTNAKYYHSADASQLANIYEDIGEKIDLVTDSDGDGLCDYYEDNPITLENITLYGVMDKNNKDTDGDNLKDGEEIKLIIILHLEERKMIVMGYVRSDPTLQDTDGDGINDKKDAFPLDEEKQ